MPDILQKLMGTIPNEAMELYCGRGFSLHVFYFKNRFIGSERLGEGGAVGKYTGKITHSKIKI